MKKVFLYLLSILLHLLLFIALILYILNPPPATIQEPIKPLKPIPQSTIDVPRLPIPLPPKEKDLIHIDFNLRLAELNAKLGDPVFVRIFKEESMLEIWIKVEHEYLLFKQYPICAFSGHLGPKLKEGDRQSPEGFYKVKKYQLNPNSSYHLSFNLGYPNVYDKAHKRTGSYLMVHGECVSIGCYAMTNAKIDEIYKLVDQALKKGQKYVQVHAFPFEMTEENMARYSNNKWYDFWTELKEGYDYFEAEKLPPTVKVKNRHYTIHEANQ